MADWIDLSATQGTGNGTFTAKASDNTTGALRKGKITYTTLGGDTASVKVVQYQKPTVQQQPPYQLQAAGGKTYFSVRSYATWWFRSIYDWITVTDEDGNAVTEGQKISPCGFSTDDCPSSTTTGTRTFTITATENTSTLSRNDNMSIGWERLDGVTAYSSYITVFQYGAVKKSEMPKKPDTGGSTPVSGETTWTATTDADWITLTKTSGTKGESVTYEATENTTGADRVGKITITYSDGTIEIIEVTQKGTDTPHINVTPETLTIDGAGGTSSVDIDANVCWTVEEYSEPVTENTKIYYTSTDGNVVTPTAMAATDAEGNTLTYTNTYTNGQGIIKFNGVVADITMQFRGTDAKSQTLKTFDGISNRVSFTNLMIYLFTTWTFIESIDLSNFDTSKVTSMLGMTMWTPKLKTFEGLNNFDTSKVTTMKLAFYECGLDTIDLSSWNTSSVTNMYGMFWQAFSTTINVRNFDTKSVTNMSDMFAFCKNLTTLDISGWNTSSVTDMSGMFYDCYNLTSLDLSNFDTSSVTTMSQMFNMSESESYSSKLTTLKIGANCTIGSSTTTDKMFDGLPSSGTLQYPTGLDSTQVAKWTPTGWTAVAY